MPHLRLWVDGVASKVLEVPLEETGQGPGLGAVVVQVVDGDGQEIVREHKYHFEVMDAGEMDLDQYVSEPEELPDLPAFLEVEPYQGQRPRRGR